MHAPSCPTKELAKLIWLTKVGEPPGDPKHNIGYDHDIVEICPTCNGATLERLRHDCFDFEEVWDQYEWYELAPEDGVRLREVAARCEQPLNPFCNCDTHKSLRTSMTELPSSSWDAVFESAAHRHTIRLTAVGKPRFVLVARGPAAPPAMPKEPARPKAHDAETVLFIFAAWPAAFIGGMWLWFRVLDLHWLVDTVFSVAWFAVSFVLSGAVLALWKAISKPSMPS